MKLTMKLAAVATLAISILSLNAVPSFAYYHGGDCRGCFHGGGDPDAGAALGIIAAFEGLLLTTISADAQQYDAQTLQVEAAEYEDTRVEGVVFEAFANQVRQDLGAKAESVDRDTLNDAIAKEFLEQSLKNR
ncbi:MAG: hypothetical protein P4M08_14960 [Oligoflexia bacterium]|nr:hypothetical protein [Oligoflexia bacterium]